MAVDIGYAAPLRSGAIAMDSAAAATALPAAHEALMQVQKRAVSEGSPMAGSLSTAEDFWDPGNWKAAFRPYEVTGSVAQVPVSGVLLPTDIAVKNVFTGYEYIEEALLRAEADDDVTHVALNINSPGGYLAGLHAVVKAIRGMSKPVTAFVNESALSAAYYIAAAAGNIVATEQAYAGSIGVIMAHVSFQDMLEGAGIKVTLVYKGERKADGDPDKHLSKEALAEYKAEIDKLHAEFVGDVAEFRGLDAADVAAQESRVYRGVEALDEGLVDEVVPRIRAAFEALVKEEAAMADKTKATGAAGPEHDEEDVSVLMETKIAEARAEGATAERERIAAILNSPAAEGRQRYAVKLALNPALTAEAATELLEDLPEDKPVAAAAAEEQPVKAERNHFEEAMAKEAGAPVGMAEGHDENDAPEAGANPILRDFKVVTGRA